MPGLICIIPKHPGRPVEELLVAMSAGLQHEPFYTAGTLVCAPLGCGAGWTAHQGAMADCQPIWNERRDVCLVFAGETFPEPAVIARLRALGHEFDPADASYLVHLYEEEGGDFFRQLNGIFSGVLLDLRRATITVFNDRYGMNRIYWHEDQDGYYFASEAKALLRVLPATRQIDPTGLGELLSCGCVLGDRSIFSGVSLLPGGSAWTFAGGRLRDRAAYFTPAALEDRPALAAEDYYESLKAAWRRVLPRYFQGKQAQALSLTGGVDSRMVLGWADLPPGRLPCYTFGGSYRECRDVRLARELARRCGQSHEIIPVADEFLRDFPRLARKAVYITDGATDLRGTCDLFCQQRARLIAPVRVSGVYGGEILRRLVVFKPQRVEQRLFAPETLQNAARAEATYQRERQGHALTFTAFKQAPWHIYGPLAIDRTQVTFRTPYLDNEIVDHVYQAPPAAAENEYSLRLVAEGNRALAGVPTDRGVAWPASPASQARHLFEELTFKAEYAYDYGMPQWLAALDRFLRPLHPERLFLGRHKFYHFRVWYRDQLAGYVKEVLLDPRARARFYLRPGALEKIVNLHTTGRGNYTSEIHRLLQLELIQRELIESF